MYWCPCFLTVSEYVQFSPAWGQRLLLIPSVADPPQGTNTPVPWRTSSHPPLNCNGILPNLPITFCVYAGHPFVKMVQSCPGCKVLSYPRQLVVLPEVNPLQEWVGQKGPHPKNRIGACASTGEVEWSPNFIVQFLLDMSYEEHNALCIITLPAHPILELWKVQPQTAPQCWQRIQQEGELWIEVWQNGPSCMPPSCQMTWTKNQCRNYMSVNCLDTICSRLHDRVLKLST